MYLLITYVLPIISARAVPQQINFYNEFSKIASNIVGELEVFN